MAVSWAANTGNHGNATDKNAGTSLNLDLSASGYSAGDVALVVCASNNQTTSSQVTTDHQVSDSVDGSTGWVKLKEFNRSSGSAADGVCLSVWVKGFASAFSGTITLQTPNVGGRVIHALDMGSGFAGETFESLNNATHGNGTAPSTAITGDGTNYDQWIGAVGIEGPSGDGYTGDTDFGSTTPWSVGTTGGSATTNIAIKHENDAQSQQSLTFNPTLGTGRDFVAIIIALRAAAGNTPLVGSSAGVATASGNLTTSIKLAGASAGVGTGASLLTTSIKLVGASAGVGTATSVLTTQITLRGTSDGVGTGASLLTTQIKLAGTSDGVASAVANLTIPDPFMFGTSAGTSTAVGNLTTSIRLVGASDGTSTASSALTTQITLAGTSTAVGSAVASLTTSIRLAGLSAGVSTGVSALTTQIRLVGASAGTSTAQGNLTTSIKLVGVAPGQATAVASFQGFTNLQGASAAGATATGALTTEIRLVAIVAGTSTAASSLTTAIRFAGVGVGSSTAASLLTTQIRLSGMAAGQAFAEADLQTGNPLVYPLSGDVTMRQGPVSSVAIPRPTAQVSSAGPSADVSKAPGITAEVTLHD